MSQTLAPDDEPKKRRRPDDGTDAMWAAFATLLWGFFSVWVSWTILKAPDVYFLAASTITLTIPMFAFILYCYWNVGFLTKTFDPLIYRAKIAKRSIAKHDRVSLFLAVFFCVISISFVSRLPAAVIVSNFVVPSIAIGIPYVMDRAFKRMLRKRQATR